MLKHFDSPLAAQSWCHTMRKQDKTIGFVPTMGALHAGHLSLIQRAALENALVVVSIFINPLQFDNPDDLEKYPRDQIADFRFLEAHKVDVVFTGSALEFLGDAHNAKTLDLPDPSIYSKGLEGAHRPGHFQGVLEIVSRLFGFVGPCRAYFGEKDYQQVQIIRELAAQIHNIEVITCATSREASGLARSSRNQRLSEQGKQQSAILYEAMLSAKTIWQRGERDPDSLQQSMLAVLKEPAIEVEYAEIRDPTNWTIIQPIKPLKQARAFVAAKIEDVRLIDTLALAP